MSCYFRHLKDVFAEAGIEVTTENKKQIDRAIHEAMGFGYKDCPATWRRLKQDVLADEGKRRELMRRVREAMG